MTDYNALIDRLSKRYNANELKSSFATICSRNDLKRAADAITELLARTEKAEKERDAAVKDLRGVAIESCAECMYCLYRTAKSFCQNCQDGSSWRWRGIKEE